MEEIVKRVSVKRVTPCPFNFLIFLNQKGLLKKELLFTQRLKLEEEFFEWCKAGSEHLCE